MKGPREKVMLPLTSDCTSESRWSIRADATLVVNDLRDMGAVWHDCIVCKSMAYTSDVGLVGTITLRCVVTCHPSAVAADYEPLKRLGGGGGARLGCHRES